ncbi:MAG: oxaloacetate decarboxylase alpha subunit, partial [Arenicella sp.]
EGKSYVVTVNDGGDLTSVTGAANSVAQQVKHIEHDSELTGAITGGGEPVTAPLAGNVIAVQVVVGQEVSTGDTLIVLEAMKMETNISASRDGRIADIKTRQGETVSVGDVLLTIS